MEILQYKNFLSDEDLNEINKTINSSFWKYGHQSDGPNNNKFWVIDNLEKYDFYSKKLLQKICDRTEKKFTIERIYMNGHTFGNHGNIHRDAPDINSKTFLIYCNNFWHPEYGGGTSFIVENNEVITVYPEPKSAVMFSGYIEHFSAPLSHSFKDLRVTLAYKLYEF